MCQGCVENGYVTQKVEDAIEAFRQKWPDSEFGPAHIVIADSNVTDGNIQWCLDHWDEYAGDADERLARAEEYAATKAFLLELLTWPEHDRVGPEDEYEDEA